MSKSSLLHVVREDSDFCLEILFASSLCSPRVSAALLVIDMTAADSSAMSPLGPTQMFALSGDFFGQIESSSLISSASETLKNTHHRLKIYLDWGLVREGGFHNQFIEERATIRGRQMRDILVREFEYQENINL